MTPPVLSHSLKTKSNISPIPPLSPAKSSLQAPAKTLWPPNQVTPLAQLSVPGRTPPSLVPTQAETHYPPQAQRLATCPLGIDKPSNALSCKSPCLNSPKSPMIPPLLGDQDPPTPSLPGQALSLSPEPRETHSASPETDFSTSPCHHRSNSDPRTPPNQSLLSLFTFPEKRDSPSL